MNNSRVAVVQDHLIGSAGQVFSTWEVILLTTLNLALVLVAVVGNAIVCVLLRFRYMHVCHLLCRWFSRDKRKLGHVESAPNELWADEYLSSQHECSCGKTYPPSSHGVMNNRYVVFQPIRKSPITYATGPVEPARVSQRRHSTWPHLPKRHTRVSQHSSITSLFLFNLSLADFLMALFIIPIYVVVEIIYLYWPLGHTMCKLSSYLQGISVFVSALTHVVISWDRVVLVYFPLRPRMSHRSAVGLILGVWILACIIPFPMLVVNQVQVDNFVTQCVEDWTVLFPNLIVNRTSIPPQFLYEMHLPWGGQLTVEISSAYTVLLMILQYFLPLGVICGTYAAIAIRIKRLQTPGERDVLRDQKLSRARQKMVKMLTTVAILYGLSQLPRHIVYLHGSLHREFWQTSWSVRLWTAVSFTRDTSTCYNPLIYAWVNKNYRHEVYRLLRPFGAPLRALRKRLHPFRHAGGISATTARPATTRPSGSRRYTAPMNVRSMFLSEKPTQCQQQHPDNVRLMSGVPNFVNGAPVIPTCYAMAVPLQTVGSGSVL